MARIRNDFVAQQWIKPLQFAGSIDRNDAPISKQQQYRDANVLNEPPPVRVGWREHFESVEAGAKPGVYQILDQLRRATGVFLASLGEQIVP